MYTADGGCCVLPCQIELLSLPPPPSLPLSLFLPFLVFTGTQAVDLEVDESSFTGETIPSRKSTLHQVNLNRTAHAYN